MTYQIHHLIHIISFTFASIVFIEIIQLLPFIEGILNKETFEKMYDVWIVILVGIFIMELSFIMEFFFRNELTQELSEMLGMAIFLVIMVGAVRKSVIEAEIISGTKRRLEKEVDEKTGELRETIEELKDTKTAVLNMLEDLDNSHKKLKEAYDELKTLDEMKDNLLSNVSHELRTPLTICSSAFELLKESVKNRQEISLLGLKALERQNALIEDLVDMARLKKGDLNIHLEEIDIREVIETALKELEPEAIKKGIKINSHIDGDLPKVEADPRELRHILKNLLINAIKFNKIDGEVVINSEQKEDFIEISIEDNGIGISKEHIKKVFDRFYQVDSSITRRYGGAGLGLSVVKDLIEAQGGKIWVESKFGQGTTIYFTLPIFQEDLVLCNK